jgi:hypothetical protein
MRFAHETPPIEGNHEIQQNQTTYDSRFVNEALTAAGLYFAPSIVALRPADCSTALCDSVSMNFSATAWIVPISRVTNCDDSATHSFYSLWRSGEGGLCLFPATNWEHR